MSSYGKPEFEFYRLCEIFGLSAVRKASVLHYPALLTLEGFMRMVDNQFSEFTSDSLF